MLCPNCQSETTEGAAFCPACGSELPKEPAQPAADDYAAQQARYQAELAAYQWQQAAYEQQQYASQPVAPAPRQAKKGKGGLVAAIVAIALLLLVGCGVGGVFAMRAWTDKPAETEEVPEATSSADDGVSIEAAPAAASAEEAMVARLAEEGLSDWVFDVSEEGDGYVIYLAGPPASEYASQYLVEEASDGWYVTEATAIGFEDVEAGSDMEAEQVVWEHLICVYEDRGLDAQSFTVDPFHSDSASAQVSAGGLTDYNVVGSLGEPDGSYWVQTTQVWYGSTENWEYWVVPTEAGYRIADVQPW